MSTPIFRVAGFAFSTSLLAACGGGSSLDVATASSAAGLYNGSTSQSQTIKVAVLGSGQLWLLYSAGSGSDLSAGFFEGGSSAGGGTLNASSLADFQLQGSAGVTSASLSASYGNQTSLDGTVTYTSGGSSTFTSTFDSSWNTTPALATVAATYAGTLSTVGSVGTSGGQVSSLTVSSAGSISGTVSGTCSFSGTLSPQSTGNVYSASITFGSSPCSYPGKQVTGIALYDSSSKTLRMPLVDSGRVTGVLFTGVS